MRRARAISHRELMTYFMEKTVDQPFIADSSALVSLIDENDHNHKEAVKVAEKLRETSRPIILPLDVFVETINVIGKKFGHDTAMKAARYLRSPDSEFLLLETRPYLILDFGHLGRERKASEQEIEQPPVEIARTQAQQ